MCGIVGMLKREVGDEASETLLRRMLGMVRHRGPDESGLYLGDGVALGHARLSILDLAGGQQPISNEDERLWIVFNGEIFNHVELRAELEAKGHRFATATDTEVIVHLYEECGLECLRRLNGQFALAIWDEQQQSLLLARDRLGVRPLFYSRPDGRLVFASEIKALLVDPQIRAELDPIALGQVFTYWCTVSPRTVFRGIQEVPPGHYLVAKGGEVQVAPYWQIDFPDAHDVNEAGRSSSPEAYAEELHDLLLDATRIRLRADVPVGAYLSGGLDSSCIAAMVQQLGGERLDTFSITFTDTRFDESAHQRRMAEFLGTEHQVVLATHEEIGRVFPDVVWHTETPLLRTAPAPMFLLSKRVHDHGYKVVLTGEGADEFLGGYDVFKEAMVRRFWARCPESKCRPLLLKRLYPDIPGLGNAGDGFLQAFFRSGLQDVGDPAYSHAVRWRNNRRTHRFFSAEVRATIASEAERPEPAINWPPRFGQWSPLAQAQYLEISLFLSQYLLSSQGDRVGMAHSIEGRFPFLDARVVDFCNRLPPRLKLRGLTEKYLLRRVAGKYLPQEVAARPKRPYRAPIHRCFFHAGAPDYVRDLLSDGALRRSGWFNASAVAQLVAKLDDGRSLGETDDMALVGVLSTQLVHAQFVERLRQQPPVGGNGKWKVVRRAGAAGRPCGGTGVVTPTRMAREGTKAPVAGSSSLELGCGGERSN